MDPGQQPPSPAGMASSGHSAVAEQFFSHSSGKRVNTDATIATALRSQYPGLELVVAPAWNVDLLGYAAAGHASVVAIGDDGATPAPADGSGEEEQREHHHKKLLPSSLVWKEYQAPSRRIDGSPGALVQDVLFGKFLYTWRGTDFILYLVDGRDGTGAYPAVRNNYILTADPARADALVLAAGQWGNELHEQVWVWDLGRWYKSTELFESARKASWDAVILDEGMKRALVADQLSFFDSRETYRRLGVPWKRGLIFYGPPGNGKTISIKAMMHTLYDRKDPVPTLYVRSFSSFGGPEYAISQIFAKARQFAPCYLIFEDLDSLVTDAVRSYFLNEIDGLQNNDGIFMVGSTNHLDRLDPGISKRPSRFDRKYYFPDPDLGQREAYCRFWQRKLAGNEEIDFPDRLCGAIARITDGFSFAYMQEAFVAALVTIARGSAGDGESSSSPSDAAWEPVAVVAGGEVKRENGEKEGKEKVGGGWVVLDTPDDDSDDDLDHLILWVEIKKQVAILRESMEEKKRVS
ncbi:hypothetical protein VTH06DRAFT_4187 [Thermothelomyces fergusii]